MQLSPQQKQRLIGNATQIYLGYLALDFSKTKPIFRLASAAAQNADPISLVDLYQIMARENKKSIDVVVCGKQYQVNLQTNSSWQSVLTLRRPITTITDAPVTVQALGQYTDEEIAAVFAAQSFTMSKARDGSVDVSLSLKHNSKQLTIGGRGKLDLYRTHLVTLLNITHKLQSEQDLSALLVALATGTGKTFVQALWMEVLYLSDVTAIFAVPDELVTQFIKDMRKLLPDNLVEEILTLRKADSWETEQAQEALLHLNDRPGSLIVADSRRLIDDHHQALLAAPSDQTFLSVDEQHLLMGNERRRKRLLQLPTHLLSLFLTATPDQETYRLSGERPVASMSSRQKQEAGQGRLPKYETIEVPFFSDLNRRHTTGWWQWLKNSVTIGLPNMLFPEISSAAQFAIERLPFHFHYEAVAGQPDLGPRWNLHASSARKILTVIDDNETLVNFMHYLRGNSTGYHQHIAGRTPTLNTMSNIQLQQGAQVYSRGAFEPNGMQEVIRNLGDNATKTARAASVLAGGRPVQHDEPIPLWGAYELIAKERAAVWSAASAQLPDEATKATMKKVVDEGMVAQLKSNMFHYLIEYVLTDLTGLDQIKLNHMRKHDLPGLMRLVRNQYSQHHSVSAAYYQQTLEKMIGPAGAQEISPLLATLYEYLGNALTDNHVEKQKSFVDNWFLDRSIMDEMTAHVDTRAWSRYFHDDNGYDYDYDYSSSSPVIPSVSGYQQFASDFKRYANKYLVMAVMTGMDDAETQVADAKPFCNFAKDSQPIFDQNGRFSQHAKQRQRHSLQILVGQGNEDVFTPKYLDLTEEQSDNYFRLGFIGTYVSNKKQKGFSDLNLHTVLNLAEQTVNPNNAPEITIQASGRNRGLDETVVPSYIHVLGHKQTTHFDPKMLDNDDYYTDFFTAQGQYNNQCIDLLGVNLAKRIRDLYFKYKGQEGEAIDATSLHAEITEEIALYLRDINNRNSHNIGLSRKQLTRVVAKAMSILDQDIANLRNPYKLSPTLLFLAKFAVASAQTFFYALNFNQTRKIQEQLQRHKATLSSGARGQSDNIYLKLMRQEPAPDMSTMISISAQIEATIIQLGGAFRRMQSQAIPKKLLPKPIQTAIATIEREAGNYGYTRGKLLTILNYSQAERMMRLSSMEQSFLLPKLVQFEQLLRQNQMTNAEFFHSLDWTPPQTTANDVAESFEQSLNKMMQSFQALQRDPTFKVASLRSLKTAALDVMFGPQMVEICHAFEMLSRDDLITLLSTRGQRDAATSADRILAFMAVVKAKNGDRFQEEFLTYQPMGIRLPLVDLMEDCAFCGKEILKSHEYVTQKRYDKTYLKIIRQTRVPDMIGMVVPGVEFFAWLRKQAVPLRVKLFEHLVKMGALKDELTSQLNQIQAQQMAKKPMPASVKAVINAYEVEAKACGYGQSLRETLRLSAQERLVLPESLRWRLDRIDSEMDACYDFSMEDLASALAAPESGMNLPADLIPVMVLFQMAMQQVAVAEQAAQRELGHAQNALRIAESRHEDPVPAQTKIQEAQAKITQANAQGQATMALVVEQVSPIIFHPQIADACRLLVGNLNREDLIALFDAHGHKEAAAAADRILALVDILENKDKRRFIAEFMTIPAGEENLPLFSLLPECMMFAQTIVACTEHFTQTDFSGSQYRYRPDPERGELRNKFLMSISERLRDIQMPHRTMATRVQQGKGFFTGLTNLAKVSGDANGDDIRFLTRIKNHILRPMWWTTSLSKWAFAFVEGAKNVAFWFRDLGFTVWNKLRQFSAWMDGRLDDFRPFTKSPISTAYNATTFEAVRAMNDLKPLTARDVAQVDCPDDAIVQFEKAAAQRRTSRLFVPEPAMAEAEGVMVIESNDDGRCLSAYMHK